MKVGYVLGAGVVVNTIVIADDADPSDFDAVFGPANVCIGWTYDGTTWAPPVALEHTLDDLRAGKLGAIAAAADALLAAGAAVEGGLHVALDDGSRADLPAMAPAATAAASGAIAWPEAYARGWITIENIRIPLATPVAGLTLAASVGYWYAAIVQHRRDLKDTALAAADETALAAIDETAGWPV